MCPQMNMVHVRDPAEELFDKVGDLDEVEVPLNKVLIGIYLRPEKMKTKGGVEFLLTDQTRDEDKYQGKAGLILKRGPMAFVDDDRVKFNGFDPKPGDWVMFRPSTGLKFSMREVLCIIMTDTSVELTIPTPDMIF